MSLDTLSFGCRLNLLESEVMRANARAAGFEDAVLINTCAVTGEAVRQARQAIRKARRERPGARIVVSGCAVQTDPEAFAAMEEVALVLGNAEKLAPEAWRGGERVRVADAGAAGPAAGEAVTGIEGHTRAFVAVQNGCDHRCTFCIIPYGRGPSRSVPMGGVVETIRGLVARGFGEVVLTGVDLTAYGADLPGRPTLGKLVATILKLVPDLPRLRLSSLDTIEVDAALMAAIAGEERLMPHFHLSLQAGDDMILKRMKRRHLRDDAIRFCAEVRALRPDAVFGADLIAGFPTETEDMFDNARRLAEEARIAHLHVFPYSPRPGTPAARMPQLDRALVKERAARLRETGATLYATHLDAMTGTRQTILVENNGLAHTENFTLVVAEGLGPGALVPVTITGHNGKHLTMQVQRPQAA